jgi:uncharacterized protein YeeX (DUF496 family)
MARLQEKQALNALFKIYEAKRDYEILGTLDVDDYVLKNANLAFKTNTAEMENSLKTYAAIMKGMPEHISANCPSVYDSIIR